MEALRWHNRGGQSAKTSSLLADAAFKPQIIEGNMRALKRSMKEV